MDLSMPDAISIDPHTTTWLLRRPHPLPDFYHHGVCALTPRLEQTVLGRVVAETDFEWGDDRYGVVAILTPPDADGVHRLLDLGIRRRRDQWPTLCTGLQGGAVA